MLVSRRWGTKDQKLCEELKLFNHQKILAVALILIGSSGVASGQELDTRQPIQLSASDKQWVLNDMRGHLTALTTINVALGNNEAEIAQKAAVTHGMAELSEPGRPENFRSKTNPTWVSLAISLHKDFDSVAQGIAEREDAKQIHARIGKLMQNCVACHAAFKIVEKP